MKFSPHRTLGFVFFASLALGSCDREGDGPLEPPPLPDEAEIFGDDFASGISFHAFGDSKLDALQSDPTGGRGSSAALKVTVPAVGDPSGAYAGGAIVASIPRDLTGYNALTFWARASSPATLDVAGLGNDNTGLSLYTAQVDGLPLTTGWQRYVVPFPLSEVLGQEAGMFYFAEGPEEGLGNEIWLDDLRFDSLSTITNPRPAVPSGTIAGEVGATHSLGWGSVTFTVDGADLEVGAMPSYFTFTSSDPTVANVDAQGVIIFVGEGTATVTAALGTTPATGETTLEVVSPPTVGPAAPERAAENVISLFSDAYDDVPVDTWSADWDVADVADLVIAGDAVKRYSSLVYAGIEFASSPIDASGMNGVHFDLWLTDPSDFRFKLVDFGPNGVFGGDDDTEHEIVLTSTSNPALSKGSWNAVDLPLSSFGNLASRANLAQIILSGNSPIVYLDNLYFYSEELPAPAAPAPDPTADPENVISLFSDSYDDVAVDSWSAEWDVADVADVEIEGNATKHYTNLVFAGIEFVSETVDASGMTHFNFDLWTPSNTDAPAAFKVKLVDFGADGGHGGGDDTEHELTLTDGSSPPLATGVWLRYCLPLSAFTDLASSANLAQIVLSGDLESVFLDNVYFSSESASTPSIAAPTPTADASKVISLFSDAYDDVAVDSWSAEWDQADVADIEIAGNPTKHYTNLAFAGVEFTSATIDIEEMTHFNFDLWTPDPTANALFKVKLVDFGPDGVYEGGDDVEHEVSVSRGSTPPLTSGNWVSFSLPLSNFTALSTRNHLAQLIFSGDLGTVFLDNIYFELDEDTGGNVPTEPAPTPTEAADDVISIFSDAYTDVTVDTWSAEWDVADVADFDIAGNASKLYTNLVFAGIEFVSSTIDAGEMTHFRMDIWTPDEIGGNTAFKIKLVDFGANGVYDGGGDDVEHELTFTRATDPALAARGWITFDIPLSAFTSLTTRNHLAQLIISGDLSTVFVDNIYLHR